jgi:hypothetical protein
MSEWVSGSVKRKRKKIEEREREREKEREREREAEGGETQNEGAPKAREAGSPQQEGV